MRCRVSTTSASAEQVDRNSEIQDDTSDGPLSGMELCGPFVCSTDIYCTLTMCPWLWPCMCCVNNTKWPCAHGPDSKRTDESPSACAVDCAGSWGEGAGLAKAGRTPRGSGSVSHSTMPGIEPRPEGWAGAPAGAGWSGRAFWAEGTAHVTAL